MRNLAFDAQNTRDNLNPADTEGDPLILKRKREDVFIEENSLIIQTRDVSGDTIWGVGNWGSPRVWDGTYTNALSSFAVVVNPNNIFREYLRDATFYSATAVTMTVSTASFQIEATTAGQIFPSEIVFTNNQTIISATINISTDNITGTANLGYELSANNGVNWGTATLGTQFSFTTTGTALRYRILSMSGTALIKIDDTYGRSFPIQVTYGTQTV